MDASQYRPLIEKQRIRAIDEVQNSFIDFVLIDIFECGQVEYLIDDNLWYTYWLDVSYRMKMIMDNLLVEEDIPEDEIDQMFKECIKIKMIDNLLLCYCPYCPQKQSC